ncbi:hypothetical protein SDC9_32921 [bioreactor metagenome]|jgi:hypothetical protein|uniref:FHA domain-containing protein n=1 Tax=bioreactor metagenome TaxID=1076179 RepID=A0A644V6I2_9ZZZZ|nr:FHA domain-containing protein [Lentimicrobium sp.]MEA5112383.1 FHA domain-containing protein [Lentimicrobium sp.]HCT72302.1 hypothetical protein [Bacteroidales bacterium]
MEKFQIKCGSCGKTMQVSTEVLAPYSGKTIRITCQNPGCKAVQNLKVPVFKAAGADGNKTIIEANHTILETRIENAQKNNLNKKAFLVVSKNQKTESQLFALKDGVNTIGRYAGSPGAYIPDIAIRTSDTYISKKHCQITVTDNKTGGRDFILKDAGSANGTFHNQAKKALEKDDEIFLHPSDVIILGDTQIIFELK